MSAPHRLVTDSRRTIPRWANIFDCKLSCGHSELAGGRTRRPGEVPQAPKTVACRQCEAIATAAKAVHGIAPAGGIGGDETPLDDSVN